MKDQLKHYVELLFAGASGADDIKQEILQNTMDRYDDLIAQGKAPQAAYSLAIAGIGDVSELLAANSEHSTAAPMQEKKTSKSTPVWKKVLKAVAVFLYIISAIPLIALSVVGLEILGLCAMLGIVGLATALIIIASSGKEEEVREDRKMLSPQQELQKAVKSTITTVGLVVYFALSFLTQAWHITWLVFPIMAAVRGLSNACISLKEADNHES